MTEKDDSKSPWKKPPNSNINNVDSPLMGPAASWPALFEARDAPPISPSSPSVKKPAASDSKFKGSNGQSSGYKNSHLHQKNGNKRNNHPVYAPPPPPPPPPQPMALARPHPVLAPLPLPMQMPVGPYIYRPAAFAPMVSRGGSKAQIQPFVPPPLAPIPSASSGNGNLRAPPFPHDAAFPPQAWRHQYPPYPVGPQGFRRPNVTQPGFMVGPRIPGKAGDI